MTCNEEKDRVGFPGLLQGVDGVDDVGCRLILASGTVDQQALDLSCSGPSRSSIAPTSARASAPERVRSQFSLRRRPQALPSPGYLSTPMARM
jgi:hypothetical protein